MKPTLIIDLIERLPAGVLSRAFGFMARQEQPRAAVNLLKRAFVAAAGIDLREASTDTDDYVSLLALFTRELDAEARPIDAERDAVVSPVDGKVGACGQVEDGTLLQVKGRRYSLAKLLGGAEHAARFAGGDYCTLYLSPRDYHRVHAPLAGVVPAATIIPGRLLPVFSHVVARVDELFARNERLITYLDTPDAGRVAVVMVGATLVGCVRVTYDTTVRTNVQGQGRVEKRYEPPRPLARGEQLGLFELGSTVVLVAERGRLTFAGLSPGQTVRMGQRIGSTGGAADRD